MNFVCLYISPAASADPVKLDTGMSVQCMCWNHTGSILAFAGSQIFGEKEVCAVQFYTAFGEVSLRNRAVEGPKLCLNYTCVRDRICTCT